MASSNSTSSFTAVNDNDFSQLDLNGKIIIKAQYIDDIRRIPIIGDEITYDELILMMQRLFKLQPVDEIHLKYRDDDNDLISIIDDNDLSFAIQYSRILKLRVFVNEKANGPALNNYKEICHELIEIRNRCNTLLEKLHLSYKTNASSDPSAFDTSEVHTQTDSNEKQNEQKTYGQPPKELDPLNNVNEPTAPSKIGDSQSSNETKSAPAPPTTTNNEQLKQSDLAKQPEYSQIAQQPVLQQAYPAPRIRPPVPNQYPSDGGQSRFQPPPAPGFNPPRNYFEPPKPGQIPPAGPNIYSNDPNRQHPMTSMSGPMPTLPSSFTPVSGVSQTQAPAGGMPPYMPFSPPSHAVPPPNQNLLGHSHQMASHHGPPTSTGPFYRPPGAPSSDGNMQQQPPPTGPSQPSQQSQMVQMPPSSQPMQHAGPMSPPQLQSPIQPPPSSQIPPPPIGNLAPQQPGQDLSKVQGPPMGPPAGQQQPPRPQPSMSGPPGPPPMMPQFQPRGGIGFSYGMRARYPNSGI